MYSFVDRLRIREKTSLAVLIILIGFILYSNTWHAPFVLDDIHSIVQNDDRHRVKWSVPAFLGTRAIPYFTLDINYVWGQLAVEGYHTVNITLHLVTTGLVISLVYLVARRAYSQQQWHNRWMSIDNHWLAAITAGLFFLVHPIQTQSVNYIVQRMVLLTTLFYVGAVVTYWLCRESTSKRAVWGWAGLSIMSSVLAMHSKEIAITLPMTIVTIEYLFFSYNWRKVMKRWWKILPWVLTVLIIPAYLLEVRGLIIHDAEVSPETYNQNIFDKVTLSRINNVAAENQEISRWTYFVTEWRVVTKYLQLIVWPAGLNIDHDIPWQEAGEPSSFIYLLPIIGLVGVGLWLFRRKRYVGTFGIIWFFLTLSVESSFIPIKDNIFEHRLYLPMIGVVIILADGLAWWLAHYAKNKRQSIKALARPALAIALLVAVLGGMTYWRNEAWGSALSLWSEAVNKSPQKARPLNNLGLAYEEEQRPGEAEKVYRQALTYHPDNFEVMINLGALLGKTRRTSEAATVLQRAIELKPDLISGYTNLGNVYLLRQDYKKAADAYRQSITLKPNCASCWASLADALLADKRNEEAIAALAEAVEIENWHATWFNRLGALYAMAGDWQNAETALQQALALDPQLAAARSNLVKLKKDQMAALKNPER